MNNDNNNQEKRERTKTVMLGPDITKEIRSQLEEYNLAKVLENTGKPEETKEKIEDSLPSSFFYNSDNEETKVNKDNNDNNGENANKEPSEEGSDYSIFGGENPIDQIQGTPERNEDEVLVNNSTNKNHQMNEIARSKKSTEEIASKIIKDLILDNEQSPNSVKDSLIKEIEDDDSIFEKFEHKGQKDDDNNKTDENDIEDIFNTPSGKIIENNNDDDIFNTDSIENNQIINQEENNDNDNVSVDNTVNIDKEKETYEYRKATQLNLEQISNIKQEKSEGIFWKEETPLVGFLVTFNNNPNGEFYELREGKLVITTQLNKNISSLVIKDESVSMMHAIMKISSDKISILDQFSENGTTVKHINDENRVELSGESEYIKDKDIITFGNITFKVCLI